MAAAARPVERDDVVGAPRMRWVTEVVHHDVLGMRAYLVVADGPHSGVHPVPREAASGTRLVERDEEESVDTIALEPAAETWASWLRIGIIGAALLVVVAVCLWFAWRTK